MNETMQTILNRRSIRAYKPEQIKDEELQQILQAAKYAPSAMNEQSSHFTVIQNPETMKKVSEACRILYQNSGRKMFEERAKAEDFSITYHAPTFILVSGKEDAIAAPLNGALALQNMFLAAESLGIGSCWIHVVSQLFTGETNQELKAELGIPDGYNVLFSGAFGYKAMSPAAPQRNKNVFNIIK